MKNILKKFPSTVRYKDPAFEQIVHGFRYTDFARKTTLLVFTGMSKHSMQTAARTLATRLGKQLYRISLGAVQSKYIGNPRKI